MSQIKVLPPQIANKIAAGEVVDRPAAVVKELIENSIDAGASEITIVLEEAGKSLIQIIDNGSGISPEQVTLAFQRHATSKISDVRDLDKIITLGFRGEALPSIASVSRMEMKTCNGTENSGVSILMEGGVETRRDFVAMKKGTTLTVKNLFFNTPARRNFLRSDATEFNHINRVLKRFFLSYPEITYKILHNGKIIYEYMSSTLDDRISQVFGTDLYDGMVLVNQDLGEIQLEGYVCRPDMARNSSENQYIFLNKRPVQNRSLNYAVMQGFGNLIERSQYPQFVLFLKISPQLVDVNVHPTKMEVRFSNERAIYQLFLSTVRNAIQTDKIIPEFSMDNQDTDRKEISNHFRFFKTSRPSSPFSSFGKIPLENRNQMDLMLNVDSAGDANESDLAENKEKARDEIEQPRLWQIHNRYICSQIKSGLVMIDQHVAHERVLYERTLEYFEKQKKLPSQKLLFPQNLDLSLEDFLIYEDIKEWVQKLGFGVTNLSGRTILIEAIPADVKVGFEGKILLEIIDYYRENQGGEFKPHEKIAAAFSCKNAIKSGEKLNHLEMAALIDQLFAAKEPYFCPHGRPVIVTLNLEEIDRKFKRIK